MFLFSFLKIQIATKSSNCLLDVVVCYMIDRIKLKYSVEIDVDVVVVTETDCHQSAVSAVSVASSSSSSHGRKRTSVGSSNVVVSQ